jgi:hypothetical protein
MFAIRTRNGNVYLKLEKRNGDTSCFDFDEIDAVAAAMKRERAGGNYGYGTKETQSRNYASTKEREAARREMFDGALVKFKKGECEAALIDFEEVVGMEPRNYLGDDFSRVTNIYRVAQYNIACCYSALDQVDAGLEALESSMACGFEDYKKVRGGWYYDYEYDYKYPHPDRHPDLRPHPHPHPHLDLHPPTCERTPNPNPNYPLP